VLLVPLLAGGMGSGRVMCIDADGSMTIEPAEAPCCGRCCAKSVHEGEAGSSAAAEDARDDCVDIPLPGHSTVSAPVTVAPLGIAWYPVVVPEFAVPVPLVSLGGEMGIGHAWPTGAFCAGSARMAHLESIIIRC